MPAQTSSKLDRYSFAKIIRGPFALLMASAQNNNHVTVVTLSAAKGLIAVAHKDIRILK